MNIVIYNQVYLFKNLEIGKVITVIGKYDKQKNSIIVNNVRFQPLPNIPQVESIYYTTNGLPRKTISNLISNLLDKKIIINDYIPHYIKEEYGFIEKELALKEVHKPTNTDKLKNARARLIYEELFVYMLKLTNLKKKNELCLGIERNINTKLLDNLINSLPFTLTTDQLEAINDILKDMTSSKRMNRLLQGDVGSGKTIVAFIACYINYLSNHQTAFMAPTEILANQHYQNALKLFKDIGITIALITSSTKAKDKKEIYKNLENGTINLIIGTQSLIQDKIIFNNLGLVITDEQHRFGVNQRSKVKEKGTMPDILSMSATPIPRTYALTIYGDMDVSNIKTKPIGRKDIITYLKQEDDMLEVLRLMKQELDLKHQIYVVVPLIDEVDESEKENIIKVTENMNKAFGKIAKIESLHGKMDTIKKEQIMTKFKEGSIDILISTTVIEVGVDVKNASMMVIFDANFFGLSTIHQLRGRVGRGDIQSFCILLTKTPSERLKILESTNDGFEISEYDFLHRGEGDIFGIKQSGEREFKIANLVRDYKILQKVKNDALMFLDSHVNEKEYIHIKNLLNNNINQD